MPEKSSEISDDFAGLVLKEVSMRKLENAISLIDYPRQNSAFNKRRFMKVFFQILITISLCHTGRCADESLQTTKTAQAEFDVKEEVKVFYAALLASNASVKAQFESATQTTRDEYGETFAAFDPEVVPWYPADDHWNVSKGSESDGHYLLIQPVGSTGGKAQSYTSAVVSEFEVTHTEKYEYDDSYDKAGRDPKLILNTITIRFLGFRKFAPTPLSQSGSEGGEAAKPFPAGSDLSTIEQFYKDAKKPLAESVRIYVVRECERILKSDENNLAARKLLAQASFGEGNRVGIATMRWESIELRRATEILSAHGIGMTGAGSRGVTLSVGQSMAERAQYLLAQAIVAEKLNIMLISMKGDQWVQITPEKVLARGSQD